MTAHSDDGGASLQPQDPLPDDLAFFRGCTVAACLSGALWIVGGALIYAAFWG